MTLSLHISTKMAKNSCTEHVNYLALDDDFDVLFDVLKADGELDEDIASVCNYVRFIYKI